MKIKVGYLGCGAWGICLANLLAGNGHDVQIWANNPDVLYSVEHKHRHPKFPDIPLSNNLRTTLEFEEVVNDKDVIVESVTTKGVRQILERLKKSWLRPIPFVLTSKGIEGETGLLLPEMALEILGEKNKNLIGCLTGPSLAKEVMQSMPSSVVASAFDTKLMQWIQGLFAAPLFRVYPNPDIMGVCFGGAMKNIIAIACGISDGLGFGQNAKAALLTRGLHEMRKLAVIKTSHIETLNGLTGLGDLAVTCLSTLSRNYTFGKLLAEGESSQEAKKDIGMVVEGAFTCISAKELGDKHKIPLPITEAVYAILYLGVDPLEAVKALFNREIKEEWL